MKVADAMSHKVSYVSVNVKLKDAAKLIFGAGINGVPVCENKKVVGFISESDILRQFFPSIKEFVEEPLISGDFEEMEKKIKDILNFPAKKIMSKPVTVTADTPLMKAQSLMLINAVRRLSVVDEDGNLKGIITTSDIFRAAVGDQIPVNSEEEYHDWLSRHYDVVVDWEKRLGNEIPDLVSLFKKEKVTNILDIGFGTGEHDIALVKNGFSVLGVEASRLMLNAAKQKLEKLPKNISEKLEFVHGKYDEILKNKKGEFQAAIFLGNAFAHTAENYIKILSSVVGALDPKNPVLVFQIINYEKVFREKKGFLEVNYGTSKAGMKFDHAFLEFYSPDHSKEMLTLNMEILDFDGKKWKHRALNSTSIAHITQEKIEKLLKQHGFNKIEFYGGQFGGTLFKNPFNPIESDWLNVIATRS